MKKATFIIIAMFLSICASTQISFERQAVASAGSTESVGNLVFCYTLGETIASTGTAGNVNYTQGFQQPHASLTPTKDIHFKMGYTIYPNPASMRVNIDIVANQTIAELMLNLYAANGRLVKTGSYKISSDQTLSLDISGLPSATYLLSFYDPAANAFAIEPFKVVH